MAGYICVVLVALSVTASAAPPAHQRTYQSHANAQLQQVNPLDYYLQNPEMDNFYRPASQKQVSVAGSNGESGRLETLEPDSEVELVPGVQQPQQPPQQNPVAPNIPGLLPGQRVFIVHMPVPGYSPGSIGGYQPVYIVAAAPQANGAYPGNGFQNAVFLDPSGQTVLSPAGYAPRAVVPPQFLGSPFALQRPHNLVYQDPGLAQVANPALQVNAAARDPIRFTNLVELQRPVNPITYQGPAVAIQNLTPNKQGQSAPLKQANDESKEPLEQKADYRATPAIQRNKA